MFNERQKICVANLILDFSGRFMFGSDRAVVAIILTSFQVNLKMPFTEELQNSLPRLDPMSAARELSSLNFMQRNEFNGIMDKLLNAIEKCPYQEDKVKREARIYLNAIKATSQLGQF